MAYWYFYLTKTNVMKNSAKFTIIASFLFICLLTSCKKTPDCETEDQTATTTVTDTIAVDSAAVSGKDSSRKMLRKAKKHHMLTTAEKDSIKAERDKLVTPPDNVGPSATPGSGRAVPGNNKPAPGNNASQSSSTGTK